MAVTVAEVLLAGRDEHSAFDTQWTPSGPALRFLVRYQKRLLSEIARWKRDAVRAVEAVALPLADFAAGYTLPEHLLVHGGAVNYTNTTFDPAPLELVAYRYRLQRHRFQWGAYVQGRTLHLLGRAEDWTAVASIDVDYFPATGTLTGPASEFELPGDPLDCLVAGLADFLAKRAPRDRLTAADRMQFRTDAMTAWDLYLDQATGRARASTAPAQEVW